MTILNSSIRYIYTLNIITRYSDVDNRLEVKISYLNFLSSLQRYSASLCIYIIRYIGRTNLRLSWKIRAGTRARSAREIPLVSKCVRLIGRRGTRARISRVHSRLPRIITHA